MITLSIQLSRIYVTLSIMANLILEIIYISYIQTSSALSLNL